MRCRRSEPSLVTAAARRSQSGAAMVVAMLVFAMAAVLIVAMKEEFQRYYYRTTNVLQTEQAQAYLRGAEDLAALVLLQDWDEDDQASEQKDDYSEIWAQQPAVYPLDDGAVMTAEPLQDLTGRFNINSLLNTSSAPPDGPSGQSFTPYQQVFIRLLQTFEEPELTEYEAKIITRSVMDWLDGNIETLPEGAEDGYYGSLTPAYRSANQPMASVSELRAVANVTPEIYAALAPLVTVWPRDAQQYPVNINTAKPEVLRSLNSDNVLIPLSDVEIEPLVEMQKTGGFKDTDEFWGQSVFAGKKLGGVRGLVSEKSSHFLLIATVKLADRNTHLYSVLHRENRRVQSLARAGGSL